MLPPLPLTDPDVQISRFRFFTGELRSQQCSDGRSGLLVECDALGVLWTAPMATAPPAATAISARSSQPYWRTSLIGESCPIYRNRHSGPAFSRPVGCAARGSADAGSPGTTPSPLPARGRNAAWPLLAAPRSCAFATFPIRGKSRGRGTTIHPLRD